MKSLFWAGLVVLSTYSALACNRANLETTPKTGNASPKLFLPDAPVKSERLALSGELTLSSSLALHPGGHHGPGGEELGGETQPEPQPQTTTPQQQGSTPASSGLPAGAVPAGNGYWLDAKDSENYAGMMRYYETGGKATKWFGGYGKMADGSLQQDPSKQNFTMMKGSYENDIISGLSENQQFVTKYDAASKTWAGQMYNNTQPYNPDPAGKVAATNSSAVYNPQTGLWNYGWTIPGANGGPPINFTTNTYDIYNASQTAGSQFQYQVGQGAPVLYQPTAEALTYQAFLQALLNAGS